MGEGVDANGRRPVLGVLRGDGLRNADGRWLRRFRRFAHGECCRSAAGWSRYWNMASGGCCTSSR